MRPGGSPRDFGAIFYELFIYLLTYLTLFWGDNEQLLCVVID